MQMLQIKCKKSEVRRNPEFNRENFESFSFAACLTLYLRLSMQLSRKKKILKSFWMP